MGGPTLPLHPARDDYPDKRKALLPKIWEERLFSASCSETLGTFFLVYTMTAGAIYKSHLLPVFVGIMVTVLHYVFQRASGSHFNPAISWATWIADPQQLSSMASTAYVTVQYAAGVLASYICFELSGKSFYYAPAASYSVAQALAMETICTSIACGAMLFVAHSAAKDYCHDSSSSKHNAVTRTRNRVARSCFVGVATALVMLVSVNVSGACLNPAAYWGAVTARAWREGPRSVDWNKCIPYYFGPYIGGTLMGLIVRTAFRETRRASLESKASDLERLEEARDKIETVPLIRPIFK